MDVISFLSQHRIPFRQHGEDHHVSRTGWINLHCPWCGSSAYHLGIHVESGRANCWRCGKRDTVEAISRLAKVTRGTVSTEIEWKRQLREPAKLDRKLIRPDGVEPLLPVHRSYLEGRGFDPDEIADLWGIQSIGISDRLSWRLYIPIHDEHGREVSWTTRTVSESVRPRYLSASSDEEAVDHKTILYGAHLARGAVVAVEGPTDAWAIGPGAVATCGTGFTSSQRNALASYRCRCVCLDADERAQARADSACREISDLPGFTVNIVLETGSDPAECDRAEIAELRGRYLASA